jgi:hypothetical protein
MAIDAGHAAPQGDRSFSVEVVSEGETATVLAGALTDFFDAVECAMDWLEREDPASSRSACVAIFATRGGEREQVWAYPAEEGARGPAEATELVQLFGFDPLRWKPSFDTVAVEPRRVPERPSSPARMPSEAFVAAVADALPEEDSSQSPGTPRDAAARAIHVLRFRLRQEILTVWGDRLSRWSLVLCAISLWLMITFLEPAFLAPLLAAAVSLWSRRGQRPAAASYVVDDWF